ncbi:MAG: ABC transporter permease, partial [Acidimicrobiia bacterium]|nr:ABC transporter permease [Acidimicrobiia bacterium]MDX2465797.1 ABC transporter permease [Acidimicrobiia bacterium]
NGDEAGAALAGDILIPYSTASFDLGADGFTRVFVAAHQTSSASHLADRLPVRLLPSRPFDLDVRFDSADLTLTSSVLAELQDLATVSLATGSTIGALIMAAMMTTSVIERRREIGLRRALGGTTTSVVAQFVTEGVVLGTFGSCLGLMGGTLCLLVYAESQGQVLLLPPGLGWLAFLQGPVIGFVASLLPALRAARQDPASALSDQ